MPKPTEKKLISWETLFDITYNAQSICEICEFADKCRTRNRPPGCPIWASLPEVDHIAYGGKMVPLQAVELATVEYCECGGGQPGACCPACDIYHDICATYEPDGGGGS